MYGVTVDFFTQYELTTSSYLTFRGNDLSHACGDSQGERSFHLYDVLHARQCYAG